MSDIYTRQVVLNGLQEDSFRFDIDPDEYDITLTGFSSDTGINETSLIWADRTGQPNTPAWNPSQIAGLSFWLDASDATTLTLTNITVDAWASKVGTISGTAPAGNRPEYDAGANGGRGAVVFSQLDPVDKQWLDFGDVLKSTNATGLSVFGVFQVRDHSTFKRTFSKGSTSVANEWALSPSATSLNRFLYRDTGTRNSSITGTPDNVDFHIHGGIYDNGTASNITGFYDGTGATATSVSPNATASTQDVYLARDGSGLNTEMSACEVLAFLRPLSTFERQVVEGYLAHKWGAAQFLPTAHPFKTRAPGYVENMRTIAYAPSLGLFAAPAQTGVGNRIITSPDGINWTTRASPENNFWEYITWSEEVGAYVAVASFGSNRVMRSTDGITWTTQTIASLVWQQVIWARELARFYVVATTGSGSRAASSPDGITWTTLATPDTTEWRGLAFAPTLGTNGRLVAVGRNNTADERTMHSDNGGTTWTTSASITINKFWQSVAWSPVVQRFVAVNGNTPNTDIAYSDDGITWAIATSPVNTASRNVFWSDDLGRFVITHGGNYVITSPDGITWTQSVVSPSTGIVLRASAFGAGKLVAVGDGGRIFTSFVGREQRPILLDFYDLTTGANDRKTVVSNTVAWERPMIHFARTRLNGGPNRYRITDATGLPLNRQFTAIFDLTRATDNIALGKARMHTRVISLTANQGMLDFDLDPATYKPMLWAYAFSNLQNAVFCRLKIDSLNMGSGNHPILVAHPGYSYSDIKYTTEYIQRRSAYRLENLDGTPFNMTNQTLSLIFQFQEYTPAQFLQN